MSSSDEDSNHSEEEQGQEDDERVSNSIFILSLFTITTILF